MSLLSGDSRALRAGSARVLKYWDSFKYSHPETAELLKPALRRLWRRLIRRQPTLATLREGPSWSQPRSPGSSVGIAHGQVDSAHHVEDRGALIAVRMEYVFLVPDTGVLLVGWLFDPMDRVVTMTARAGTASAVVTPTEMARLPRPDVADSYRSWSRTEENTRLGIACLVRLDGVSDDEITSSLQLEFADANGGCWHLAPRPIIRDPAGPLAVIRDVLTLVPPRDPVVLDRHIGPAVSALWETREHSDPVVDIGTVPADPDVSIVVPIYGRYDFIEYQMALFADDPDIRRAELIYVIDDPRIVDQAVRLCRDIYPIFRVPCRLVLSEQNNGFARATNIGAGIATAPMLLLLNSDVMPVGPGWLSKLLEAYSALPSPGTLGPRLLFPDGSLQHGGMEFVQEPWFPGVWLNDHPGKGLPPPDLDDREIPRRVSAITAACMLVARDLYRQVGGLDEDYPVGDFEDSDLCLKLRQLGRDSYVAPWVELYHLERQSQGLDGDSDWRQSLTLYNAWRHTRKWNEAIEQVIQDGALSESRVNGG